MSWAGALPWRPSVATVPGVSCPQPLPRSRQALVNLGQWPGIPHPLTWAAVHNGALFRAG